MPDPLRVLVVLAAPVLRRQAILEQTPGVGFQLERPMAVRLLQAQGRRARRLEDGLLEWRTEGNPVEVGAA